ncbi:hypothetical protein [Niabella aquatica]
MMITGRKLLLKIAMLQFPQYKPAAAGINYADQVAAYLEDHSCTQVVTALEQNAVLKRMDEEILQERIYFSVNLAENRIVHRNGISRWLGYTDTDFSLRDYHQIIHPAHAPLQCYYSASLLELFMHNEIKLQFMQPVCATLIALRHKTGKYIYCKRECSPFQLTGKNKITEYLCQLSMLKQFSCETYHTRIYPVNSYSAHVDDRLHALARKKFAEQTSFSIQELRILKRYVYQKNSTSEIIGQAFKIKKSTVNTFNKRILKKTELFSKQGFNTAKEAALYFKNAGLI